MQYQHSHLYLLQSIDINQEQKPQQALLLCFLQLIATNTNGCSDTATVNVSFNPKPNLGNDQTITKCTDSIINLTTLFTTTGLTTDWTIGGTVVSNPSAVTAAGVYRLIATNSFGCADTALVTIINDQQLCVQPLIDKITISPNPVSDKLSVLIIRKTAVKVDILIHNSGGQITYRLSNQQVAGSHIYSIPMKNMGGGIYFVTIKLDNKKELVKKVMRQ